MTFRVRLTRDAEHDLARRYGFILDRDVNDWEIAERALQAIRDAFRSLELSPFSFRKAEVGNPLLREIVIPFGSAGYVALFEIEDSQTVTVLAVRHLREDDYY